MENPERAAFSIVKLSATVVITAHAGEIRRIENVPASESSRAFTSPAISGAK
jgi:hypothetical protein